MKITLIIFLLALTLFTSCSKDNTPPSDETDNVAEAAAIRDDVAVADIANAIDEVLTDASFLSEVDDDYIKGMTVIDLVGVNEYILKVQTSGTAVTSYGIFVVSNIDDAITVCTNIQNYIDTLEKNWESFNYLPEELPKLKAAKASAKGKYVFFVIASDDERKAAEKAFADAITMSAQ